jgi:hypothetical protein
MAKFEKITQTKIIGVNIQLNYSEFEELFHIINNYELSLKEEIREMLENDKDVENECRHLNRVQSLLNQFEESYYTQK